MAVIFLTGAPDAAELDWNDSHLSPFFIARVRRYLQLESQDETTQDSLTAVTHSLAKWREVSLQRQRLPAPNARPAAQFLSFEAEPASQEHMMFLEHSLAVLQNLDSSQINAPDDTAYDGTVYATALTSFGTSMSTNFSLQPSYAYTDSTGSPEKPQVVTFDGPITDLKTIPGARHLQSIHPQTMSINFLASVISVQPPRTVKLRRTQREMDIVEILFGDETKAGFSVSFWFPPANSQLRKPSSSTDELREILDSVRLGDILLVTHVALGDFKNNVYGQSLSRRITRNNTSVTILSETVTGLSPQNTAKLDRVREWSSNFIGRKTRSTITTSWDGKGKGGNTTLRLPPDTQP